MLQAPGFATARARQRGASHAQPPAAAAPTAATCCDAPAGCSRPLLPLLPQPLLPALALALSAASLALVRRLLPH